MTRLIIFVILNFAALGIGAWAMGSPLTNTWYKALNKAPWTPPGWVFGAAWTLIMVCFSIFMYRATNTATHQALTMIYVVYALQWLLNVLWSPVFFRWHFMGLGLITIGLLMVTVAWFTWQGFKSSSTSGLLVLPYLLWLGVATSLNAYALVKN